jgi:hypothetical protein
VERMVILALAVATAVFAGPLFFTQYSPLLMASGVAVAWNDEAFVHAYLPASAKARATQEARWEGGRFRVASCAAGQLPRVLLRGKDSAFETLADVWGLPLSRGLLAFAAMTLVCAPRQDGLARVCTAVVFLDVTQAALLGGEVYRAGRWPGSLAEC